MLGEISPTLHCVPVWKWSCTCHWSHTVGWETFWFTNQDNSYCAFTHRLSYKGIFVCKVKVLWFNQFVKFLNKNLNFWLIVRCVGYTVVWCYTCWRQRYACSRVCLFTVHMSSMESLIVEFLSQYFKGQF